MTFLIFLGGYISSLLGFSLGKATKEEHHEIKTKVLLFSYLIQLITIFLLLYGGNNYYILLSIISFIFILIGYFKYHPILEFNAIILYLLSFKLYFTSEFFFIISLPLISLIIENSFKKFILKEELIKLIIIILLSIIFI